ncbi:MAG: cyclic nucleotide-binding/CBS domain-containing protein [Sandaracinaceae bacterium]
MPRAHAIAAFLERPRRPVLRVDNDTPIRDAARLMEDAGLDVVVVPLDDARWGLLTENDVAQIVVARGLDADETPVGLVVWDEAPSAHPSDSVEDVIERLDGLGRRHAVVAHKGRPIAVVSLAELTRYALS